MKHNKPCLHIHSGQADAAQSLRDFVADNELVTLNVAGPRASKKPEVGEFVKKVLIVCRLQQEKEAAAVIRIRRRTSRRIEAPSGLKHVNNRPSYTAV